jgi:Zn-dependent oligopeptidase
MILHTLSPAAISDLKSFDTTQLWHQLRRDVALIQGIPNVFPEATFGHLMGGCK